jgi:hypothetical protein
MKMDLFLPINGKRIICAIVTKVWMETQLREAVWAADNSASMNQNG